MAFDEMESESWDQAEQKAMLAYELYENGSLSRALEELNGAIQMNPDNASWHFNKGLTLDAMECFDEAITAYEKAMELNPDDPEMLTSLAVDYTRTGRYDMASLCLSRLSVSSLNLSLPTAIALLPIPK